MRFVFHAIGVAAALGCLALLGPGLASAAKRPTSAADTSQDLKPTEAQQLVQTALEAGAGGKLARQAELAAAALKIDPELAAARWANGEVRVFGKWARIDQVPGEAAANTVLNSYRQRQQAASTAAQHVALAKWCTQNSLADAAQAHLRRALELQSDNAEAIKLLGLKLQGGVWMTEAEIRQHRNEEAGRVANLKRWQSTISAIIKRMANEATSADAAAELAAISDPAAVPALEAALAKSGSKLTKEFIKTISAIRSHEATKALVRQAVLAPSETVRIAAADALKPRDVFAYVPLLLSGLTAPAEVSVELEAGIDQVKVRQVVTREGENSDHQKVAQARLNLRVENPRKSFFVEDALARALQNTEQTRRSTKRSLPS